MSNYSLDLLTSLNELGLIITNVRSLANMDASRDPEETKREKTTAKKPTKNCKKQQVTDAYTRNQQQHKSSNRGQNNLRHGKDERANTLTRPTSQDLAKASFGSSSPFGVLHRSIGNKSFTSGKKRIKKSVNHSTQQQKSNPSTSASVTQAEVVDEVDFCDDDDLETFDIDCSPYNDVPEWNEGESEREQRGANRSRVGFGSFQSGRSRRTVSPYPYRLRHKKQTHNEWAVDETTDPWDEGSFFDDELRASPALGFSGLGLERSGYREENPHFRWHAHDSVEGRLSDLNLQDRYPVVDGDHGNHLKPCLKRKTNQRHARNVSWNDENNEFDTTAGNDRDTEDDGGDKVKDKGQSYALVEERNEEVPPDASLQQTGPSQESVELHSCTCMMKTPANSIYIYDEAVSLEVDMKVGAGTGEIHSPPVSGDMVCRGDIDADRCFETKTDGKTKDVVSKCCPPKDTNPPRSLLQEWTDDAISQLTDDEKYRLMKEQEHLQIERYDDPHLCRADRIKLLWEDCARKERLLHKLRPNSSTKSLCSKGSVLTPNVNRYNHYNY